MLIAGVDIETTGLSWIKGHRIIELAVVIYRDGQQVKTLCQRFNPRRPIDKEAQAVHHIALEDLTAEPLFENMAPKFKKVIESVDLLVAHNGESFDIPFLRHEFKQAGCPLKKDIRVYDTMLNSRWATESGKYPKLSELAFSLGFTYDTQRAHGAVYDTELMLQCLFEAQKRGLADIPV